jgi:hypothetical protein
MHNDRSSAKSAQAGAFEKINRPPSPNGHLDDRMPNHNPEMERCLLGDLLLEPERLASVMETVSAWDFYSEAHQLIFRAMEDLHESGKPWDATILADEIARRDQFGSDGGLDYLLKIANSVPHAVCTDEHAARVKDASVRRQLQVAGGRVQIDSLSDRYTAPQLLEMAKAELAEIQTGAVEPWPELLLGEPPEALPFPVDVFPEPLQRFCRGAATVTLTPLDLAGAAMLAVASAAIGQSVQLQLKRSWYESTLLYMLIVGEPGRKKTPVISLVVKPLANIDAKLREESAERHAVWEDMKKTKSPLAGIEPPQRRAIVKDITRETLVAILRDNPRGVLADPDEATAWISSFNEYKAKGSDRQFWLSLWASKAVSVDRDSGRRSLLVKNPLATVLAGIPPDMVESLGEERGRNDGFLDRNLFVFPVVFPEQKWTEAELDEGDETSWHTVIDKLHAQEMFFDPEHGIRPNRVLLTKEAKAAWIEFYNAHNKEVASEDMPAGGRGIWAKMEGYCARFALILSRLRLAMNPDCDFGLRNDPVSLEDMQGAIKLANYFKGNALRVNSLMTGGTGSNEAMILLAWIKRKGVKQFRLAEAREDLRRRFPDLPSLASPIRVLVEAGAIRPKIDPVNPRKTGPKPTPMYEVRPGLEEERHTL